MSSAIMGIVEEILVKESPVGAPRKWRKIAFKVVNDYYSTFLDKDNSYLEKIAKGNTVTINYSLDASGKFRNIETVTIEKESSPAAAVAAISFSDKEARITRLACQRDAIDLVHKLVALEALNLGAKKGNKADVFFTYVDMYANKLAHIAWNIKSTDFNQAVEIAQETHATGTE